MQAWKRRAIWDAIVLVAAALLFVVATVVLVGISGDATSAASTAIGPLGSDLALVLFVAVVTMVFGGGLFITRRWCDLRAIDHDNQQLTVALLEAADAERVRLGQNLHDDLGQHLTGIGMLSTSLHNRLIDAAPQLATDASTLARLAEEAGNRTRELTRDCLTDWTEQSGLVHSLGSLGVSASKLFGIPIEMRIDDRLDAPDSTVASHITRIVSEAINNAVRHANPQSIVVSLSPIAHGPRRALSSVELTIEDRRSDRPHSFTTSDLVDAPVAGKAGQALPGLGMLIMRARARAIGGELESIENKAHGTTIRCVFPWETAKPHQHLAQKEETSRENAPISKERDAEDVTHAGSRAIPVDANTPQKYEALGRNEGIAGRLA